PLRSFSTSTSPGPAPGAWKRTGRKRSRLCSSVRSLPENEARTGLRPTGTTQGPAGSTPPSHASRAARTFQDTGGKQEDGAQEREDRRHGDADQPEREHQHPDERIEDEGQDGDGPAEKEQDCPQQELDHDPSERSGACRPPVYPFHEDFGHSILAARPGWIQSTVRPRIRSIASAMSSSFRSRWVTRRTRSFPSA